MTKKRDNVRKREATPPTTVKSELPNISLLQVVRKLVTACCAFLIFDNIQKPTRWVEILTKEICYTSGSALILSAVSNLFDKAIVLYNKNSSDTDRYIHIKRKQSILINTVNLLSCILLFTTYKTALEKLPKHISAFSFSYPEDHQLPYAGATFDLVNVPIIIPFFFALSIVGIGYNIKEIILNSRSSEQRQSDAPLFSFINAIAQIALTSFLIDEFIKTSIYFQIPNDISYQEKIRLQRILLEELTKPALSIRILSWFNSAASYTIYQCISTLFLNIAYSFIRKPKIFVGTVREELDNKPIKRKKGNIYRRQPTTHHSAAALPRGTTDLPVIAASTAAMIPTPRRKEGKVKTRGKAPSIFETAAAIYESEEDLPDIIFNHKHLNRSAKLADTQTYRRYSQFSKREIQTLLDELAKSLPNAKINDLRGSEHELCWTYKEKRTDSNMKRHMVETAAATKDLN